MPDLRFLFRNFSRYPNVEIGNSQVSVLVTSLNNSVSSFPHAFNVIRPCNIPKGISLKNSLIFYLEGGLIISL